jgi:hypothetical protein
MAAIAFTEKRAATYDDAHLFLRRRDGAAPGRGQCTNAFGQQKLKGANMWPS